MDLKVGDVVVLMGHLYRGLVGTISRINALDGIHLVVVDGTTIPMPQEYMCKLDQQEEKK